MTIFLFAASTIIRGGDTGGIRHCKQISSSSNNNSSSSNHNTPKALRRSTTAACQSSPGRGGGGADSSAGGGGKLTIFTWPNLHDFSPLSVLFPARLLWRIPVLAAPSPHGVVPSGKAPPPRRGGSAAGADDDKRPTPETAEETAVQTAAARPRPGSPGSPGSADSAGGH